MLCACMHGPISQPNLNRSERSKYLWNQEKRPDLSDHILHPKHASLHACTLCAFMHIPISQPNGVKSERSKYLWNQENRPDFSEHILHPKNTSFPACMLYACMLGPISQPNWVGSEIWRYLWNWESIPNLSNYIIQCKLVCMHTMCLPAQAHISAILEWIRYIKVSMESGDHDGPLWAHTSPKHAS